MALYLMIHVPTPVDDDNPRPPTRLLDLARASLDPGVSPRWLQTWSPDLHDDRLVSLWEAESGAAIQAMLERYGFLDEMEATPTRVRQWGPDDVIAAERE